MRSFSWLSGFGLFSVAVFLGGNQIRAESISIEPFPVEKPALSFMYQDGAYTVLLEQRPATAQERAMPLQVLQSTPRPSMPVTLTYFSSAGAIRSKTTAEIDDTVLLQIPRAWMQRTQTQRQIPDVLTYLQIHMDHIDVKPLMPRAHLWQISPDTKNTTTHTQNNVSNLQTLQKIQNLVAQYRQTYGFSDSSDPVIVPNVYWPRKLWQDNSDPASGAAFYPNDPEFAGQWFFDNIDMVDTWNIVQGTSETSIAVFDTGCDTAHEDLVDKYIVGYDAFSQSNDPSYIANTDGNSHGTSCAGLVAASTNNSIGVSGACPNCSISCVRMLETRRVVGSNAADIEAFNFALENNLAVLSNSWGFIDSIPVPTTLRTAIETVATQGRNGLGAIVVFAAGNDDREITDDELLAVDGIIGVGALNRFDEQTSFTNYGNSVDLVAPTGTLSTDITGPDGQDATAYTSDFGGTSSACPIVAGIAGLLVGSAPDKTADEINAILLETVRPAPYALPDENGHDPVYGYGIVDPPSAVRRVLGLPDPNANADAGSNVDDAGSNPDNNDADAGDQTETPPSCQTNGGALGWSMLAYGLVYGGLVGALRLLRWRRSSIKSQ